MLQFVRNSCDSFVKLRPTRLLDCCNPFVETRIRRVDRTCEDREMDSVKKKEKKKESGGKEDGAWNLWNVFKRGTAWYVEGVGVKEGEGRGGEETEEKVETCDPARKYTREHGVVKDEYSGFDTRGNLSSPVETALFVFQ